MGFFGGTDTKENPLADGKTCPNCGKKLAPGEGVRKEDGHFCCDACCDAGPRVEQKKKEGKALTCEFC